MPEAPPLFEGHKLASRYADATRLELDFAHGSLA